MHTCERSPRQSDLSLRLREPSIRYGDAIALKKILGGAAKHHAAHCNVFAFRRECIDFRRILALYRPGLIRGDDVIKPAAEQHLSGALQILALRECAVRIGKEPFTIIAQIIIIKVTIDKILRQQHRGKQKNREKDQQPKSRQLLFAPLHTERNKLSGVAVHGDLLLVFR